MALSLIEAARVATGELEGLRGSFQVLRQTAERAMPTLADTIAAAAMVPSIFHNELAGRIFYNPLAGSIFYSPLAGHIFHWSNPLGDKINQEVARVQSVIYYRKF